MKKLTPDEVAAQFVKEKLLPLETEFSVVDTDDPIEAARMIEKLTPVRLRQFFCENTERSYKGLLALAKSDDPRREEARTTLGQAVEENLTWARNNIAGFGLDCSEFSLFIRIEELSLEYQTALRQLDSPAPATLEAVAQRVAGLHSKADAIQADTRELRTTLPTVLREQAQRVQKSEAELGKLREALAKRMTDLFVMHQRIEPPDMRLFIAFMREGNQVRTAAALGIKEQTLRARVAKWPSRGPAYARLHDLFRWRKRRDEVPEEVPFNDNMETPDKPTPAVDARLLTDIAEILRDMTAGNLERKRDVLLNTYLKEFRKG